MYAKALNKEIIIYLIVYDMSLANNKIMLIIPCGPKFLFFLLMIANKYT